ncbi:hypothetical protein BVRB_9g204260 [Beta vulgaris subsp. vulgaris]|nr:hypothetical protein BVRB_9g204260 [Beta vulgaris subsp. vulgaris]
MSISLTLCFRGAGWDATGSMKDLGVNSVEQCEIIFGLVKYVEITEEEFERHKRTCSSKEEESEGGQSPERKRDEDSHGGGSSYSKAMEGKKGGGSRKKNDREGKKSGKGKGRGDGGRKRGGNEGEKNRKRCQSTSAKLVSRLCNNVVPPSSKQGSFYSGDWLVFICGHYGNTY